MFLVYAVQKMKLVLKGFFRKCGQYRKSNEFETMGKMLAFTREILKEEVRYLYSVYSG